jgi:glyoxylase-like metal-dependent hydrolase (beta-lactamase superfamily II)
MRYRIFGGLFLAAGSCLVGTQLVSGQAVPAVRIAPTAQSVVRTADTAVRGLKESDFPRLTKLGDNVYVYEALHPNYKNFSVNSLIVVTTDGVLIADAQQTPEMVTQMMATVAKITPQPIKYVVICADHIDHVGGDGAFPSSVKFIVHPFSKATLDRQAGNPNFPKIPMPTEIMTSDKKVLRMGTTEIDVLYLGRAHTGGDLEVFLPQQNLLFMSEVYFNRLFPSIATGYPSEWVATLKKAEAMKARSYIPGHGFIDSREILNEELVKYRGAVERVVSEGTRLHNAGTPIDNVFATLNLGEYGYWTRSYNNGFPAIRRVYLELDGKLDKEVPLPHAN